MVLSHIPLDTRNLVTLVATSLGEHPSNVLPTHSVAEFCELARGLDGDVSERTTEIVGYIASVYGIPLRSNEDARFLASMTLGQLAEYIPLIRSRRSTS
jgi:hypothetical protein